MIRHPQPIGRLGKEPALHQIHGLWRLPDRSGGHHVLAQRGASEAVLAHQAGHTLATHADAMIVGQLGVDASASRRSRASGGGWLQIFARQHQIPPSPLRTSADPPRRRTRFSRHPAVGTSSPPNGWPGSPSRIRRALRGTRSPWRTRPRLLRGSPAPPSARRFSRRSRVQLLALGAAQAAVALARITRGLLDPQPDRPGRRPELLGQRCRASARTRARPTICRLNSGVYRTVFSAIVNSSISNVEVSTKPGQLQLDERALIYVLLESALGLRVNGMRGLLRSGVDKGNFQTWLDFYRYQIEQREIRIEDFLPLWRRELAALFSAPDESRLAESIERAVNGESADSSSLLIAKLRGSMACAALSSVKPDIVIFDEFQRFRDLLDDPSDEVESEYDAISGRVLKAVLGDHPTYAPGLLLLSATPYTPYRSRGGISDDSMLNDDFFELISFLSGGGTIGAAAAKDARSLFQGDPRRGASQGATAFRSSQRSARITTTFLVRAPFAHRALARRER